MFVAIENQKVIGFVFLEYQNNRIRFLKLLGYLVTNLPMVFTLLPSFIKVFRKGARAMAPAKNLPDNYCTIQAIGVDPQHQGRKVGSRLLHYAHNFCRQHKEAKGIYLFTGDEKNKDIYEKIGYQLLETRDTGGIMSWHLFYEKK